MNTHSVEPLSQHGYMPLYHSGEVNHCPGCLHSHWFIGRSSAECAFCGTTLTLEHLDLEQMYLGPLPSNRDRLREGWKQRKTTKPLLDAREVTCETHRSHRSRAIAQ